jgi:hypothetical protein
MKVHTLPPVKKNAILAPHVVLLGAGASIAAYKHWGSAGRPLPSMQDLIDVLELREHLNARGVSIEGLNFESFYDDLVTSGKDAELQHLVEQRTYEYFSSLSLPDKPTIYDYLILSLRSKDLIASFNWDPFLLEAYRRNSIRGVGSLPVVAFLHGNVSIGVCHTDKVCGLNGNRCSKCGALLVPSKLLYPVKQKNYSADPFIASEWGRLRDHLGRAYFLTIFGYSAPKTDVEARRLMLEVWQDNHHLELAQVEIMDIKPREELEATWEEFFIRQHYMVGTDIFRSYLFQHPRRSCDAFAAATLMCRPWHDNPFPNFASLAELQDWVVPLIDEETRLEELSEPFSDKPLAPNVEAAL